MDGKIWKSPCLCNGWLGWCSSYYGRLQHQFAWLSFNKNCTVQEHVKLLQSPLACPAAYMCQRLIHLLIDHVVSNVSNQITGLQIISLLAPVKLPGQTYFCSDISHFQPDKHRLRLIAIKVPPPPFTWCLNMKQVNFQSIYCTWVSISMQEKWNAWYSKICITFVRTTIASVLRLIYG